MHSLRAYVFHIAGDPDNGHVVNIILEARNTRGATVRTTCPVVVLPQNFSNQEMRNASEEISEKMNQNKMPEVRGGYQKVSSGARGFSDAFPVPIEHAIGLRRIPSPRGVQEKSLKKLAQ